MKIDSIQIDGFGCLQNVSFELASGLNIFIGPNEIGKSTLQQAILALLYGFYQKNRRNAQEDELLERFRPWRGDAFGGRITVRADDAKRYRLVRSFDGELRTDLYDDGTGRELTSEYDAGRLGRSDFAQKHFGMSQEVFINTCFVRQADLHQLENVAHAISETIINLTDTGRRDRSASRAQDLLVKALSQDVGGETARTKPLPKAKLRLNELEQEAFTVKQLHTRLENDYVRRQELATELARLEYAHARLKYVSARQTRDELETKINAVTKLLERLAQTQSELNALTFVAAFPLHTRDAVNRLAQQWQTLNDNATKSDARADAARAERGGLETKAAPLREQIRALEIARTIPIARENELRELEKQWRETQHAHALVQEKLDEVERARLAKQQLLPVSDADQQLLQMGLDSLRGLRVQWQTARTRVDEAHTRADTTRAAWRANETLDVAITAPASAETARERFDHAQARVEYLLARQKCDALQHTLDELTRLSEREAAAQKNFDALAFAADVPLETRDEMLRLEQKWRTQREGWLKLENYAASARAEISALETRATPLRAQARALEPARAAPIARADEIRALQERAHVQARAYQDAQTQLNTVMDARAAKNHLRAVIAAHQELLQTPSETFVTRRTQWRDARARVVQAQERADAAESAWRALEMEDAQFEPLQERLTGVDAALLAELKTPPLLPPAPKPSARPIFILIVVSAVLALVGLLLLIFGFVTGAGISLFGVALLIAALVILLGAFVYRARRKPIALPLPPLDARLTTRGFESVAEMDAAFAKWQTARPLRKELFASERAFEQARAELQPLEMGLVQFYKFEGALSEQGLIDREMQVQTWRQESRALDALDQTRAEHEQTLRDAKQSLDTATSQWRAALAECGFTGMDSAQETRAFFTRLEERHRFELLDAQLRGMDLQIKTEHAKETAAHEARTELQRVEGELEELLARAGVTDKEIARALETYRQRVQAAVQYRAMEATRAELERERRARFPNITPAQLEAERDMQAAVSAQLLARYPAFANLTTTDAAQTLEVKRAALVQARPILEQWQGAENALTDFRAQLGAVETELVTLLYLDDASALTDEKIAAAENQVHEWTRARTDLRGLEELLPQRQDDKARARDAQNRVEDSLRAILLAANLETVDLANGVADFFARCENQRELLRVEERLRVIEREIESQRAQEEDAARAHRELNKSDTELRELFARAEIPDAAMPDALKEYERRVNLAERQRAFAQEFASIKRERDARLQNGTLAQLEAQHDARAAECAELLERHPEFANSVETETEPTLAIARAENQKAILHTSSELASVKERLQNAFAQQRPLAEIEEEMGETREKIERLTAHQLALEMAMGHLAAAADEHHRNFLPRLNHLVGSSLKRVTDGRYHEVHIDHADLQVRVEIPALHRPVTPDKLSRGAQEQIYLLLRLGLTELLSNGRERLPLLLDDPLVNYDRARLHHALDFLSELALQSQILLFTKDEQIVEWFIGKNFDGDAHRLQWMDAAEQEKFQQPAARSSLPESSQIGVASTPSESLAPISVAVPNAPTEIILKEPDSPPEIVAPISESRVVTEPPRAISLPVPQQIIRPAPPRVPLEQRGPQRQAEPMTREPIAPRAHEPKPELVCWRSARVWQVGIVLDQELARNPRLEIYQGDELLAMDYRNEQRWRIESFETVRVQWTHEQEPREIFFTLDETRYFVFKLHGNAREQGRRVRAISTGSYMVVAPEAWRRDEEMAGAPSRAPEPTAIEGYRAHFFDIESNDSTRIAFLDEAERLVKPEILAQSFRLVGDQIFDAERDKGPLFGLTAPRAQLHGDLTWAEIKTILVGEEGRGEGEWRKAIRVDAALTEQSLDAILSQGLGWYFARFYSAENELIESLDFRFCGGLKKIVTLTQSPLPDAQGHLAATLEIHHDADTFVTPSDALTRELALKREGDITRLVIPNAPRFDTTRWNIDANTERSLEIVTRIDRVWWTFEDETSESPQWQDRCVTLALNDFDAVSEKAFWIRLPAPRWAERVGIRFGNDTRTLDVRAEETVTYCALRGFNTIADALPIGVRPFQIEIQSGEKLYAAQVGELRIAAKCKKCDYQIMSEMEMLEHVRANHLREYFRPLTFPELATLDRSLPREIYRCGHCSRYEKFNPPADRDPTGNIMNHIKLSHPDKAHSFTRVYDATEIRDHVIQDLLDADKCVICSMDIKYPNPELRWDHLRDKHAKRLYQRV